jgi:2-methylisocitrate lyase-like PEP mutase family enzyme
MEVRDLVKNVINGVYNTLPHLMSKEIGFEAIRQISIKTSNSPGLPIFNQLTIK